MFIAFTVIAVVAALFVAWLITRITIAKKSKHWSSIDGVLSEVAILKEHRGEDGSSYFPAVKYQYKISGNEYSSNRLSYGVFWFWRYDEVTSEISGMNLGQTVVVYYDPIRPTNSVLIRGHGRYDIWILVWAVCLLLVSMGSIFRIVTGN